MVRREIRAQKRHHAIMKTIEEVRDWLIANRTNRYGDLDLCGLDFSRVKGNVDISSMKVSHTLCQDRHEVKGDLFQGDQKVEGDLLQGGQKVEGILEQMQQQVKKYLLQDIQQVKGAIYQDGAKE